MRTEVQVETYENHAKGVVAVIFDLIRFQENANKMSPLLKDFETDRSSLYNLNLHGSLTAVTAI